ncbi:hypothetical protein CV102_14255 [Natronococcus pandeyae]|uniref:Uncharacterized protein n=1 Tax=Natronococcus pandeyae TaxID=2055836 RepID=A0A8J8Q3H0_9EURY|nr:hypothetical protein [Natronococcus pandeyae]TYL37888.1 hypothetical protein CV102_14255 [Natronococcus pandeyae]
MMWQVLVFLAESVRSLFYLVPTLRDSMAHISLGTSVPSATIGFVVASTANERRSVEFFGFHLTDR